MLYYTYISGSLEGNLDGCANTNVSTVELFNAVPLTDAVRSDF